MQLEIDSLREQVNKLKDENTRFKNAISYYISTWPEDVLCKQICCATLYQNYLTWCDKNDEQALSSNNLGKKFSQIDISRKQNQTFKEDWKASTNNIEFNV
ncbi:hypothetical protein C1646_760316 [Rhizophagus diaphanus]|nr:hypothetical protein C1646_760316 [Rhizophagus diaphanus] [Rhizophagus sp. MUCL 43196]